MIRRLVLALALAALTSAVASAQPIHHGKLRVTRAAKGQIDLTSGMASFKIVGWELLPSSDSDGMDPATQTVTIGIAEEKFLIPAGQLRASRNGQRFRYKAATDRGVQLMTLAKTSAGTYRVTMKLAGVDLSSLVVTPPPVCLSFAVIIGDDDGFTGVSFDRPRPFPSKLLTIPGFCDGNTDWPWA